MKHTHVPRYRVGRDLIIFEYHVQSNRLHGSDLRVDTCFEL